MKFNGISKRAVKIVISSTNAYFIMSIKTFFATWIETGFKENYRDIVKILQIFLSGLMGTLSY